MIFENISSFASRKKTCEFLDKFYRAQSIEPHFLLNFLWILTFWSMTSTATLCLTRTKTSIRYAKENDREKRERKKGRRRYIEREGEIRERQVKGIERVKGARSKPNPSPNAFPRLCDAHVLKRVGDAHGSLFERKILVKSPEPGYKAQRKFKLWAEITRRNYFRKLSPKIMSENYQLVYQWRRKVEIYRETGVSKNTHSLRYLFL